MKLTGNGIHTPTFQISLYTVLLLLGTPIGIHSKGLAQSANTSLASEVVLPATASQSYVPIERLREIFSRLYSIPLMRPKHHDVIDGMIPLNQLLRIQSVRIEIEEDAILEHQSELEMDVPVPAESLSLFAYLDSQLSRRALVWKANYDHVLIAEKSSDECMSTLLDLQWLVRSDQDRNQSMHRLLDAIEGTIAPDLWISTGGNCQLHFMESSAGTFLWVYAPPLVILDVDRLLVDLQNKSSSDPLPSSEAQFLRGLRTSAPDRESNSVGKGIRRVRRSQLAQKL